MADPNYAAFLPDPMQAMTAGSNYVNQLYAQAKKAEDDRAMQQAGQQYATGDYNAASSTLAQSGNIPAAQQIQQQGAQSNSAGIQYISKALPVLQKIAQVHAQEGPMGQAAALTAAFDHIAPEAKQLTGVSDKTLLALRQSLATDPQGTLDRLQAMVPTEFHNVGDTMFATQNGNVTNSYTGTKYLTVGPTQSIYPVGGSGQPSPQMPSGAATPEQPPAQSGTDLFGGLADPNAVASIESKGNPNAVSPAGAIGTMQTMPGTLHDPGFGVTPAQDNSRQEQTRVGQDYLHALGNQYGNPVDQLVAYNWGPGNAQRWIQQGRHWDQLPRETQLYLGRAVVAQMAGRQPPPLPPQAPQQPQSGLQPLVTGAPAFRPPTPDEAKQYPGASYMTPEGPKYPPAAEMISQMSPDPATIKYWGGVVAAGGNLPPLGMGPQAAAIRQAILKEAATVNQKKGLTGADQNALIATTKANTATLSKITALRSASESYENTMLQNIQLAQKMMGKGAGQYGAPVINRWTQYIRKEYAGDPDVAAFNTAVQTVKNEYAKIQSGSIGNAPVSDASRREAEGMLDPNQTPQQIQANFNYMVQETGNRLRALRGQEQALRSGLSGKSDKPTMPTQPQRPQSGGAKIIRYDAQGNRIQ